MGFETGIDIQKMAAISRDMEQILQTPLQGMLYKLVDNKDIQLT
jgi:hypothetical protein